MATRTKSVALLLAAIMVFTTVGCGFPPSRIGFIEKIARENRRIAHSTREFRGAVISLKNGQPADAGAVRKAYQEMEKTVKEVQADMDSQPLPSSSSAAKPFLSAYKQYLSGQQDILTYHLLPIVKKVEEPGGSPAEKWAFVNGKLSEAAGRDNADFGALKQAQDAYASEHNYTVQTQEAYLDAQKAGKQ